MISFTKVACAECGTEHEIGQGTSLPESGGALYVREDRVTEFVCGECWASRHTTWTCVHCGDASYELAPSCRGCGRARPGLPPYQPDWDLTWKEERERQREHDALVAEWDREYPGWRLPPRRSRL